MTMRLLDRVVHIQPMLDCSVYSIRAYTSPVAETGDDSQEEETTYFQSFFTLLKSNLDGLLFETNAHILRPTVVRPIRGHRRKAASIMEKDR